MQCSHHGDYIRVGGGDDMENKQATKIYFTEVSDPLGWSPDPALGESGKISRRKDGLSWSLEDGEE